VAVKTENTPDTRIHSENIQHLLTQVIDHTRRDVEKVDDPKFQALLETTAEVLGGLRAAFEHYSAKRESAWR
jgi:hypothetical protein